MTPPLPPQFTAIPLAHRGLHDLARGIPENSRAGIAAAAAAGYGIEIDLQLSADHQAMVFHDYDLKRLTGAEGALRLRQASDLAALPLTGGDEAIPTLAEILELVAGRVPLLIEVKDQDGALGPDVGPLEEALASALASYAGPVAVMSFNPHSVALLARLCPDIPRGLTTESFRAGGGVLPAARRRDLARIADFDRVGAAFISHDHRDLGSARVAELKARGVPILCWTIRSPEEEARARRIADGITFEGYLPPIPA